jgi:short-subunit dehydrogenase
MGKREIEGSRALVTGASSGIGREIALQLARRGALVVGVARREERLRTLVEEIQQQGGEAASVAGDLTSAEVRQSAIKTITEHFGGLDILVNNAGVGAMGRFEQADPERLGKLLEVNFVAPVEMIRLALPLLKRSTAPIIVNVSSVLGHIAVPHCSEYCATKFALQGFSQSLRAELAAQNIDVLVVSPGTTETEFFDSVVQRTGEPAWPVRHAMPAAEVARQTVRAIVRGRREIIPFAMGRWFDRVHRLAPGLIDRILARYA